MLRPEAFEWTPPRVTVVTPTFNRAGLIEQTIESILCQTFKDFEYFVIDDGSTDQTREVVGRFRDPRLTYFWHENRGEAATTNRGWAMARGEYFAILSSDDLAQPRWLERAVRFMDDNPELLVAYPDWDIIDLQSRVIEEMIAPDYDRDRMIACFHPFPGVGAVIRKSVLRGLLALRNPDYRYAPDLDCWLRLSLRGPFARIPENLASWRSHDGSITVAERQRRRAAELIRIATNFHAMEDLPEEVRRLRPFTLAQAHVSARWVVQDTHPLRAAMYLRRAYRLAPVQPDNILPFLRRAPRPDGRELLRLLGNSLRHRALPVLRSVGRRMPLRIRHAGGRALLRLGVIKAAAPPVEQRSEAEVTAAPIAVSAPSPAQARFDAMLPQLQEDLAGFRDSVGPLTPTKTFLDVLRGRAAMAATTGRGTVTARILERLPSRIDHLLIVPWISTIGGSETVTARLIEALRRHYGGQGVCVIAPDVTYRSAGVDAYLGLPFCGFSDIDESLDAAARWEILDRVLIQRRPKVVHCVNSNAAWHAFRERASAYAADSALFANIYSDIRLGDGAPAASYYYDFLPHCIESLTAVIADNHAVLHKAETAFGLGPALRAKLHVVRTPVLGIGGGDPEGDLRPFRPAVARHSLWLSRLAKEKRLDVLALLAQQCPDRSFTLYGHSNGIELDLAPLERQANVEIVGDFRSLDAIPYGRFDSYVFTTSGEGMPIAVLEMAAKGLPVIAPHVGGIGEFVSDETGWLISRPDAVGEYADALSQIATDPDEARRRVEAAQALLLRDYTCHALDRALRGVPHYLGGYA